MVIRELKPEEHGRTRTLYETVFSEDEKRFVEYYYRYRAAENVIFGAEDAAGLHAMAHLNPCGISWNGKTEEISYLVAVATQAEYRHQGLMRRLLELALRREQQRKAPFVFLMPAAEAIYFPFGFRRAWNWRWEEEAVGKAGTGEPEITARERSAGLQAAESGGRFWIPLSVCKDAELEELSRQVNRKLADRFSLFVHRTPAYYRRLEKEQEASGGRLDVFFENGIPVTARCSAREEFPPMMARITDLEAFLARVRTRRERTCFWRICDPILPANDGCFEVTLTEAGGRLRRLPEHSGTADTGGFSEAADGTAKAVKLDISQVPGALGDDNPFARAMICEVV